MASIVQARVVSQLAELGSVENRNSFDPSCFGLAEGTDPPLALPQTPTSSSEPAPEHVCPVARLAIHVDGFYYPRKHIFTDRLVGRFYEDSSLDAETRKTSKCLAGRLGTNNSNHTTRPNTTAGNLKTTPHWRSSSSPTSGRYNKVTAVEGSSSAEDLACLKGRGTRQQPGGVMGIGLSARKEQVEREIMEQKALIEKLEGRMASMSSTRTAGGSFVGSDNTGRGATAPRKDGLEANRKEVGDRPATTPGAQGTEGASDRKHECSALVDGGLEAKIHQLETNTTQIQMAGRGPVDREKMAHPENRQREENTSAVRIQRTVRGAGKRKMFVSLQAAREEFEHQVQTMLSLSEPLIHQAQSRLREGGKHGENSGRVTAEVEEFSACAVKLLEASREDGVAKPPYDILQAMYRRMENLKEALTVLVTTVNSNSVLGVSESFRKQCFVMRESCSTTEQALDNIKINLGAGIKIKASRKSVPLLTFSVVPRDCPDLPVGSGRAAVVATASARGGLLNSPDSSRRQRGSSEKNSAETGSLTNGRSGIRKLQTVPLSTLGMESIGRMMYAYGFGEHAPDFIAQEVDGMMLSNPDLSEADLAALGLGGGRKEGGGDCRAQMVSFFRVCQKEGIVAYVGGISAPIFASGPVSYLKPTQTRGGSEEKPNKLKRGIERNCLGNTSATVDGEESGRSAPGKPEGDVADVGSSPHLGSADCRHGGEEESTDAMLDPREGEAALPGEEGPLLLRVRDDVVVTVAYGLEKDLIHREGRGAGTSTSDVESSDDESDEIGEDDIRPASAVTESRERRTSLGFCPVVLDLERDQTGRRGSKTGDGFLPPEVGVNTTKKTLNVFT